MPKKRTNEEWLRDLRLDGSEQQPALDDLRDLLLRAALYFFSRNLGDFGGLGRDEVLHRAEDCAQDALLAVMQHLPEFRGDSRFSTWAYKFAINIALTTARHERWKGVSLDDLGADGEAALPEWLMQDKSVEAAPEQNAMRAEVRGILREVIEKDLTDKQRQVLLLMVFNEVPMDEVVRRLGANRNAVYKLLHDARRRLKSSLEARGFDVAETLNLFAAPG